MPAFCSSRRSAADGERSLGRMPAATRLETNSIIALCCQRSTPMKREIIRVEPLSSYLDNWKAPASVVTRAGDAIYVSGLPPFDPATGKVIEAPIERQTEIALDQLKLCLETAGSSLENVLKCNVYCTSV